MKPLDKVLMPSKGFAIVRHPEAMNMTKSTAFLYTASTWWPINKDFMEMALPAPWFGTTKDNSLVVITYDVQVIGLRIAILVSRNLNCGSGTAMKLWIIRERSTRTSMKHLSI